MGRYELEYVHPATWKWLEANCYKAEHHVPLRSPGKTTRVADFIATSIEGDIAIVECKVDCETMAATIRQIKEYWERYPNAYTLMIAVPNETITSYARNCCKQSDIILVGIEPKCAPPLDKAEWERYREYFKMMDRLALLEKREINFCAYLNE